MRDITLDNGERLELSTVGRRIGAEVFDGVLMTAAGFTIATVTGAGVSDFIFLLFVLGLLAYRIGAIAVWGQTIGKAAVGIEVVRLDGLSPPGWGKSTIRWAVGLLPLGIPVVGFVYLLAWFIALAVHAHRRGWHDLAAGTVVVHKETANSRSGYPG